MPRSAIKPVTQRSLLDHARLVFAAGLAVFALGAGVAAPALAGQASSPAPVAGLDARAGAQAVAVDVRIVQRGGSTRLEFDLSRSVAVRAFALADPDRIVVDLPEVAFRLPRESAQIAGAGLIKAFRYGHFAAGRSRIVIDLARPARIERAESGALGADAGGPARLVVELAPEGREAFRARARRAAVASGPGDMDSPPAGGDPAVAPAVRAAEGKKIVVIDAGHGGVDAGAVARQQGREVALEKDIVLDFARDLAALIEKDGRLAVVMTRRHDVFVSLDERVRMARSVNAALFVSIHADSLQSASSVQGATAYTLSDRASDAEAARLAETENAADRAAGLEAKEDAGDVADILFELTRRETRAFSNIFSRDLVQRLGKVARMHKNPSRSAGFRVLRAPDVPSVLLELGYLSSDQDVQSLSSPEWRGRAAGAVAASIIAFLTGPGEDLAAGGDAPTASIAPVPAPASAPHAH